MAGSFFVAKSSERQKKQWRVANLVARGERKKVVEVKVELRGSAASVSQAPSST